MAKTRSRKTEYMCPKSGLPFKDEAAAAEYLKKQAKAKRADARDAKLNALRAHLADEPRLTATSIPDLEARMLAVLPELLRTVRLREGASWRVEVTRVRLKIKGCREARLNENRYNRPLSATPKTELRLDGEIEVTWSKAPPFGFTPEAGLAGLFRFIHTGCGHSSRGRTKETVATYDLTLCLDDFPLIGAAYEAFNAQQRAEEVRRQDVARRAEELFNESAEAQALALELQAAKDAVREAERLAANAQGRVSQKKEAILARCEAQAPLMEPRLTLPF